MMVDEEWQLSMSLGWSVRFQSSFNSHLLLDQLTLVAEVGNLLQVAYLLSLSQCHFEWHSIKQFHWVTS